MLKLFMQIFGHFYGGKKTYRHRKKNILEESHWNEWLVVSAKSFGAINCQYNRMYARFPGAPKKEFVKKTIRVFTRLVNFV